MTTEPERRTAGDIPTHDGDRIIYLDRPNPPGQHDDRGARDTGWIFVFRDPDDLRTWFTALTPDDVFAHNPSTHPGDHT